MREVSASYYKNIGIYAKYQIITKGLSFFVVFPFIALLFDKFISSLGRVTLSSGDFKSVIFSVKGAGFVLIFGVIIALITVLDINSFIAISYSIRAGNKLSFSRALKEGLISIKNFFSPAGAFLLIFTLFAAPLAHVGLKLSSVKSIKIPNFISSVIYDNDFYFWLYISALGFLACAGFFLILSFHYMQLKKEKAAQAMTSSIHAVRANKNFIFKSIVLVGLTGFVIMTASGFLILHFIELIASLLAAHVFWARFFIIFLLFSFIALANLLGFLLVPLQIHLLTGIYYEIECGAEGEEKSLSSSSKKKHILLKTAFFLAVLVNIALSLFTAIFFDDIFRAEAKFDVVAHRGGGDLGAENTISGLNAAIDAGAAWSEIDVMRSKDGVYIINHDKTFARLTGVKKSPSELTWEEIRNLEVKNAFNPAAEMGRVPGLDEIMSAAKGRIGLLIELKAPAADEKMVDDVAALIKNKDMLEGAVIISLDYDLIAYAEQKYPEIDTGYLYFFAFGSPEKINADYLLMEEAMVQPGSIKKIHREGKKAVVWTVNDVERVKHYIDAGVDGIITDRVLELKRAVEELTGTGDIDLIMREFKAVLEDILN